MRLALETTLLLLIVYGLGVFGLYRLVDHTLEKTAWNLMEQTTEMLGSEIGSAITDPILQKLLSGRKNELKQLSETIFEMVQRSQTVQSAILVNSRGEPVAATGMLPPPDALPEARDLFETDRRPRLVSVPGPTLGAGNFVLDIPLLLDGEPMAYLRLALSSTRIADLYSETRRILLLSAGFGLLLIGVLGFLLHTQVARRERFVVRTLEGALEGKSVPGAQGDDDLDRVVDVAGRLGAALTEERSLRSAAQKSMAQLEELLDVGVVLANSDGKLAFAGSEARELLGLDGALGDGEPWKQTLESLQPGFRGALAGGHRASIDIEIAGPLGQRSLRCHIHALEQQANSGFVILLRDRGVLLALETDLRQAVQLRGLTRLYRGVVHDLKAPINAMVLNLELLKQSLANPREAGPDELASQCARVQIVEEELARLGRALETVLSQAAPARAQTERFDVRELIREIEQLLGAQARQQEVGLRVETPKTAVPVTGHRDALKQAALNLAINSLEAMPESGTLTISLRTEGAMAIVAVQDSGPGIPASVRGRVFELRVTTKLTGTGIGLYVARTVAEADGGSLRLAATGDDGTLFEMALPLAT